MKNLAEAKKTHNNLLGDIQAHLVKEADKPSDRRQDVLHPSEMAKADWCPRQSFYRLAGTKPTNSGERHSFQLETIFAEGHEIHRKWQQWLRDMGRLWGTWICDYCKVRWVDTSPAECPNGHEQWIRYKEVPLHAEEKYSISGHADGVVGNELIEIKSIGLGTIRFEEPALLREYQVTTEDGKKIYDLEALWKGIKRPLNSHLRQTGIYGALAKEMGLPLDKVTFLYEYKPTQAVKAFTVKFNPDLVAPLLDSALDIKHALTTGTPVARPPHTGRETAVCKACPFLSECYKGEPDGTTSDAEPTPRRRGRRPADGPDVVSGEGLTADAGLDAPEQATGRTARTAGRPHRTGRRGPDAFAVEAHELDGVHRRPVGSSGGGRKVVRRATKRA